MFVGLIFHQLSNKKKKKMWGNLNLEDPFDFGADKHASNALYIRGSQPQGRAHPGVGA